MDYRRRRRRRGRRRRRPRHRLSAARHRGLDGKSSLLFLHELLVLVLVLVRVRVVSDPGHSSSHSRRRRCRSSGCLLEGLLPGRAGYGVGGSCLALRGLGWFV